MTVTLASMSMEGSDENTEAPVPLKLFWGIVFAVIASVFVVLGGIDGVKTVSYTHLDVYKRQPENRSDSFVDVLVNIHKISQHKKLMENQTGKLARLLL